MQLAGLAAILGALASTSLSAETVERMAAPAARQGVAVDSRFLYAVDNGAIAKYDRKTGRQVAQWSGDPRDFPHINSCRVIGPELVCAASNYPATPMESRVEVFDPATMKHVRTIPLGHLAGSLTWVDRRDGAWWAGLANYDGRGGERGRDHRDTLVARFDDHWRMLKAWTLPPDILERIAPMSISGGAWGADGRLYLTGHDKPEFYELQAPEAGGMLQHIATIDVPVRGQAIAFEQGGSGLLFGIVRASREIVGMKLPPVEGP
jgi:hypothetical protein